MGCPRTAPVSRLPPMPRTLAAAVDSRTQGHGPLRVQCLLSGRKFSGELAAAGGAGATVASSGRHGPFTHCAYSVDAGAGRGGPLCSVRQGAGVCLFSAKRQRRFRGKPLPGALGAGGGGEPRGQGVVAHRAQGREHGLRAH